MSRSDKTVLRQKMLRLRRALPPEAREEKSERIIRRLTELPVYQEADCVLCYLSKEDEPATDRLIRQRLAAGRNTAVPVLRPEEGIFVPARLADWEKDLITGPYGIREPAPAFFRPVAASQIDLVLVPGVVFDRRGNRIGFGKGYYDRFLRTPGLRAPAVALAFALQVVPGVPAAAHDVPVDAIVTEDEVIDCRKHPGLEQAADQSEL